MSGFLYFDLNIVLYCDLSKKSYFMFFVGHWKIIVILLKKHMFLGGKNVIFEKSN